MVMLAMFEIDPPEIEMLTIKLIFEFHQLLVGLDGSGKLFHQSKSMFSKPNQIIV